MDFLDWAWGKLSITQSLLEYVSSLCLWGPFLSSLKYQKLERNCSMSKKKTLRFGLGNLTRQDRIRFFRSLCMRTSKGIFWYQINMIITQSLRTRLMQEKIFTANLNQDWDMSWLMNFLENLKNNSIICFSTKKKGIMQNKGLLLIFWRIFIAGSLFRVKTLSR